MTETEYDLHTKGARHSFDTLEPDRKDSDIGAHDAISVQLCRDAGLDDTATNTLLRRLALRADVENARLRETIAEQNRMIESISAGLMTERDALREALTEVLRVNETHAGADVKVWAKAMLKARAALAQEQGEIK